MMERSSAMLPQQELLKCTKRKAGPGHRILQECDRRCPRQAMLAAQMQKSADQAEAAVSVVITATRPVAVVFPLGYG